MKTLAQAESYLHQFTQSRIIPGPLFLERTRYFLNLLENPQNKLRVIHIAGTSGKSSTASFISHILANQNLKVGLQLSPHLADVRERVQINNGLVSKKTFVSYIRRMKPYIEQMKQSPHGLPSYFEIMVCMGYLFFFEQKVDYAVIETGVGGITDPTNSVTRPDKLCVLTRIGYDHTEILGDTLHEISSNKAGIIQKGNDVLCYYQSDEIQNVFVNACIQQSAQLHMLQPKETYSVKNISPHGIDFTYAPMQGRGVMYHTPLLGAFQIENLSLALRVTEFLSERDRWEMSPAKLKQTVETIQMPGRVQIINQNKVPFLIDTAHNEQKMDALLETLRKTYPHSRFLFVVAFKKGKDYKRMIEQIAEVAEKIIITRFLKENQDVVHKSVPTENISYELNRRGYHAYEICENTQHALNKALKQTEYLPVITGSLYFVGDLYERYTSHI